MKNILMGKPMSGVISDHWVPFSCNAYLVLDIMRNNFRSNSEWPFAVPHAEIV